MVKKILFVCLGNICRSPAAEAVFWSLVNQRNCQNKFEVDSAGTGAWHIGKKADQRMLNAASKRGIKLLSIARQITIKDFEDFDLIMTMDSENYKVVNNLFAQLKVD